jgi:hypothetical protein
MIRRYLVFGLLVYLLALAALAPASVLAWLGERFGQGRVAFDGVSGSLWNGRAKRLAVRSPDGRPVALDDVRWQVRPFRLLWGAAPIHVENRAGDLTLRGDLWPLSQGVRLADASLSMPLARLATSLAAPMAKGLSGDFELSSSAIRLARPYRGKAEGTLRVTAGKLPAGTYAIDVEGAGDKINLHWHGPQGPRAMSGGGWWDGALHLDGVPGAVGP